MGSPNVEVGSLWPPFGIQVFNPFQVPLLNTIVLISSGIRVTWAHHALIEGNFRQTYQGLFLTVLLGIYFTMLQGLEYYEARFVLRWDLWLNLSHCDRVSWITCYCRDNFFSRNPASTQAI